MSKIISLKIPDEIENFFEEYSKTVNKDGFEFNQSSFTISALKEKIEKIEKGKQEK